MASSSLPEVNGQGGWAQDVAAELKHIVDALDRDDAQAGASKSTPFQEIFRVRKVERELNQSHFHPEILYMGLLHALRFDRDPPPIDNLGDRLPIEKANRYRMNLVAKFLKDVPAHDPPWEWNSISEKIVPNPKEMQQRYYQPVNHEHLLDPASVRCALTLDAIFLVQFGWCKMFPLRKGNHTTLFDILKLENQVPLDAVRDAMAILFETESLPEGDRETYLFTMCCTLLERVGPSLPGIGNNFKFTAFQFRDCPHLLSYVCKVMQGSERKKNLTRTNRLSVARYTMEQTPWTWESFPHNVKVKTKKGVVKQESLKSRDPSLPSASKLREAGIKFLGKEFEGSDVNLTPVFELGAFMGTLHIPTISILHSTELLWRNMVAYEMKSERSNQSEASDFIYFLQFMDELINTEADVKILSKGIRPVITQQFLGEDEHVANLFNSILQHYEVRDSEKRKWRDLRTQIHKFYNERRRRVVLQLGIEFSKKYLSRPWLVISSMAAILLLVLTLLQTIYAIHTFNNSY